MRKMTIEKKIMGTMETTTMVRIEITTNSVMLYHNKLKRLVHIAIPQINTC